VTARPEILILGGGPAGCAAAIVLAGCGHDVLVVAKPLSDSRRLPESVPPSTHKLFDVLGVRAAIDSAGFIRSSGNTVWWGDGPSRVEAFGGGVDGWQVTADRLEPLLQQAAIDAGAHVEIGRLNAEDAGKAGAAFTFDCTGRAGVIARARGLRRPAAEHNTVALVGLWQMGASRLIADPGQTWIESFDDGWVWSVPSTLDRRYVALMVDPRTSDLAHDQTARSVYLAELEKTRVFSKVAHESTLLDGPSGWDASMYDAHRYVDDRVLLVGDAGSFIDPLSSVGVKKAMASGWLAAVAAHTALIRPSMARIALDFFSSREAEIYSTLRALTKRYLADAAMSHRHPFWSDRGDGARTSDTIDRPLIQGALERLRSTDSVCFRRGTAIRAEDRPAINGCEVVLERRVISDEQSVGVRYLHDVDVVALLDLAPSHTQVPDLFDAYNRAHAPVPLPDFLTALATTLARGWLIIDQRAMPGH
jgi:2-polyprenyl-6-methoxyphenol hydroxylase-like FAD-dependent oxidoreductase